MINLMPPKNKESVRFGSYNTRIAQSIFLVLVVALALFAVIAFGAQIIRSDEAKLEASIAAKQTQLEEYADEIATAKILSEKIDTVDVLLQNEIRYSVLLQEVARLLPPGSGVRSISLTTAALEEAFTLEVFLINETTATQLQHNLISSELFTGADIQQLSAVEAGAGPFKWTAEIVASFNIEKLGVQQ